MENFRIEKELGKGSFGKVYLAYRYQDQRHYAIKSIYFGAASEYQKNNSLNEVRILASLRHPNIISYKESFYDETNQSLCLVMEFADKQDLSYRIKRAKRVRQRIPEKQLWEILKEITQGLGYLHNNKILHRDLKPANVFASTSGYKIGDMNVSKALRESTLFARTQTGTPYYSCPQTWNGDPYSEKGDIWSLGVIMYELCNLRVPFPASDIKDLCEKIMKYEPDPLPVKYSDQLTRLIFKMLSKSPDDRPSVQSILEECEIRTQIVKECEQVTSVIIFEEVNLAGFSNDRIMQLLPASRFSPVKRSNSVFEIIPNCRRRSHRRKSSAAASSDKDILPRNDSKQNIKVKEKSCILVSSAASRASLIQKSQVISKPAESEPAEIVPQIDLFQKREITENVSQVIRMYTKCPTKVDMRLPPLSKREENSCGSNSESRKDIVGVVQKEQTEGNSYLRPRVISRRAKVMSSYSHRLSKNTEQVLPSKGQTQITEDNNFF